METQKTETLEDTKTVETGEAVVTPVSQETATPDVAVAVDGVEVAVTDTKGGLELTPVTGLVGALVLGLLAVAVVKLRK